MTYPTDPLPALLDAATAAVGALLSPVPADVALRPASRRRCDDPIAVGSVHADLIRLSMRPPAQGRRAWAERCGALARRALALPDLGCDREAREALRGLDAAARAVVEEEGEREVGESLARLETEGATGGAVAPRWVR